MSTQLNNMHISRLREQILQLHKIIEDQNKIINNRYNVIMKLELVIAPIIDFKNTYVVDLPSNQPLSKMTTKGIKNKITHKSNIINL